MFHHFRRSDSLYENCIRIPLFKAVILLSALLKEKESFNVC